MATVTKESLAVATHVSSEDDDVVDDKFVKLESYSF